MAKQKKLSAAEKQRRYRERRRQNHEKEAANKAKDRDRYHAKKCLVDDLASREHRAKKKKWREYAQQRREKIRQINKALPPSPPSSDIATPGPSGNSLRGRKLIRRNRSRCVRENNKLRKENASLSRRLEKYKKRLQRAKALDLKKNEKFHDDALTPKSKATRLLSGVQKGKKLHQTKVYRTLVFHSALVKSLKAKYLSVRRNKKKVLADVASSTILKKYRMESMASKALGLAESRRKAKERRTIELDKKELIQSFFVKDDISRATAGKKETITRKKVKKQIRYLTDSMKHHYQQFLEESGLTGKVSYTTFTRCRPFYVLVPQEENRDTCLCKLHSNLSFKAKKLREVKAIETDNIHELVNEKTCDKTNAKCMYNLCNKCKEKTVPTVLTDIADQPVFWWQWDTVTEEREKIKQGAKQVFKVKVTVKQKKYGSIAELEGLFQKEMKDFKTHTYNIKQQNIAYNTCKANMQETEALLHIDFSENYNCKLSEEVQSYHFGASRSQATLHTGILHIGGKEKPISFCSVSASTDHDPPAIWAHLNPVFQFLRKEAPDVEVLHFFTDGQSTQYRQKKNFYLFSTRLFDLGFKFGTWSYFEAGHGKGAADGIGAAIKRKADFLVAHGQDIPNGAILFDKVKEETTVRLFFVTQADVDAIAEALPTNLVAIKGTRKIHQLVTAERGMLSSRNVSCYCKENKWLLNIQCPCNFPYKKNAALVKTQRQTAEENDKCKKKRLRYEEIYSSSEDELEDQYCGQNNGKPTPSPDESLPSVKPTAENQNKAITVDDFVLAEYPRNSKVHYVGKVLQVNSENLTVDFMRRVPGSSQLPSFVWPESPDIEDIFCADVVLKLKLPTFLRRGRFTFDHPLNSFTVK